MNLMYKTVHNFLKENQIPFERTKGSGKREHDGLHASPFSHHQLSYIKKLYIEENKIDWTKSLESLSITKVSHIIMSCWICTIWQRDDACIRHHVSLLWKLFNFIYINKTLYMFKRWRDVLVFVESTALRLRYSWGMFLSNIAAFIICRPRNFISKKKV